MNVREDTLEHTRLVEGLIRNVAAELDMHGSVHDASKFESPEREMYEIYRPRLDSEVLGSEENKHTLQEMGEGLRHHYRENRHHPEYFENGIAGMNLIDLTEMVCDWMAAAARKGQSVNMEWASKRFGIASGSLLYSIIQNTVERLGPPLKVIQNQDPKRS